MLLRRTLLSLFFIEFAFELYEAKSTCSIKVNSSLIYGSSRKFGNSSLICEYLNIPYARSPRRFEPASINPIDELIEQRYVKTPTKCIQGIRDSISGKEDCLFLNIYYLRSPKSMHGLRPVVVYIHGGTFNIGSPQEDIQDFEEFLLEGIIFVTINYRLGLFGFASFPGEDIEPNLGLKDQTVALKWIQLHISHFNGDPKKVTLAGWSAGAAAVSYHLYSERSSTLFQKAIIISGSLFCPWAFNIATDECTKNLCEKIKAENCTTAHLQNLPANELIPADLVDLDFYYFGVRFACFLPTSEYSDKGTLVQPYNLLGKKVPNDVPVLMGYTSLEENCDSLADDQFSMKNYRFPSDRVNSSHIFERLKNILQLDSDPGKTIRLRRLADTIYGVLKFAETYSNMATKALYLYRFASAFNTDRSCAVEEKGAFHGDDMQFIFRRNVTNASMKDSRMRLDIIKLLVNFVKFGTPTPPKRNRIPQWIPYNVMNRTILNIGGKLKTIPLKVSKLYRIWDSFQKCLSFGKPKRCKDFLDKLTNQGTI